MRRGLFLVFLAVVVFAANAFAQDQPPAPAPDLSRIEQLKALAEQQQPQQTTDLAPTMLQPELLGEEGAAVMREALAAYYQYRINGYDHRQRVFAWQLLSSRIIFGMVILLVAVGVYFSWLQFRAALKGGTAPGERSYDTTFEASTTGLKVSSPVLGVIILALSLAFFYLYLLYVYPITDIL